MINIQIYVNKFVTICKSLLNPIRVLFIYIINILL